jgi:hypothetical protein
MKINFRFGLDSPVASGETQNPTRMDLFGD